LDVARQHAGKQRRTAAHVDDLRVDAVFGEKALILGDPEGCHAEIHRGMRNDHLWLCRSGAHVCPTDKRKKQTDHGCGSFWHQPFFDEELKYTFTLKGYLPQRRRIR